MRLALNPSLLGRRVRADVARARRVLAEGGRYDPELVHRLRINGRRLQEYARMAGDDALANELRWLVHRLAPLRDLDVIAATVPSRVRSLRPRRLAASSCVARALGKKRTERLLASLAAVAPLTKKTSRKRAKALERKVERLSSHVQGLEDVHALRRSLRNLRYCWEWLGLHPRRCAQLRDEQALLGAVIDRAVVEKYLSARPGQAKPATP